MVPASKVIAAYFIARGVGSKPNDNRPWPVYVNQVPTSPDEIVVVMDSQGTMQGRIMPTGEVVSFPGINVRVRGRSFDSASAKTLDLMAALDAALNNNVMVDNVQYKLNSVQRTSDLLPLGREEGGMRELVSTNGLVTYGS